MPQLDGSRGYPRPLLVRENWMSLNGPWEFAIDLEGEIDDPRDVVWTTRIVVPFAAETRASGVEDTRLFRACWYRRSVELPQRGSERLLLHFGAVDHRATVWVNGCVAAVHEGGYTPFSCDITRIVGDAARCQVVVRAEDDPLDLEKPRGKQDWQPQPHSIWYTRSTGIWQTVWLERVPATRIDRLRWTPNLDRWEIACSVWCAGLRRDDLKLHVRLSAGAAVIADDVYSISGHETHRRIALSDPGIDDSRNELLWNPARPQLMDAELTLRAGDGTVLDHVRSYTALRSVAVDGNRFILNGRPCPLRLVLDQGYWPESGITAPDDAALRRDVELAKAMGFNGVRKHQKIEDPRFLYWADRLGLMVWAEMPSAYRFTTDAIRRTSREWMEAMLRDESHPCVIAWVPFNESWGVPNLPNSAAERHYVRGLYHLTKTLDPTRPVVGNDGWESVATDIIGIHDYDADPARLARRYHADEMLPRLFRKERPGGRSLVLEGARGIHHPLVLTEFGGISCSTEPGDWGYVQVATPKGLRDRYRTLLEAVHGLQVFAGFCYTQFTDTYQEANGLLRADRTPKFPIAEIHAATTGLSAPTVDPDVAASSPRQMPPTDASETGI